MKNFKILFSIAVASALVGCSSMAIDEDEALEGNLPADFDVEVYRALHPELERLQIKDYIANYNAALEAAARSSGTYDAYKAQKDADDAAFEGDTATIHKILVTYAGFTDEQWNLTLQPTVKDSVIYKTWQDTVALGVKSKSDAEGAFEKIFLCNDGENRAITYSDTVISSVVGYADRDSSCTGKGNDQVCTYTCKGDPTTYSAEDYEFNTKASSPKAHGMQTVPHKDSIGVEPVTTPGMVNPSQVRVAKSYNFYDSLDDLAKIAAIKLDLFAISYQYSAYGRDHGWTYRRCTDAEKTGKLLYELNPETLTYVQTAPFPSTKLYCADENGDAHELN